MIIHYNGMAMNAYRHYNIASGLVAQSMERLSSGHRINRAADDAAGLAISERMRAQIRGLNQAARNCQDGISLLQTAEGALQEAHAILQRMNELAVQSATGTNQALDRQALAMEFNQLREELWDISRETTFNDMPLLDGSFGAGEMEANWTGFGIGAFAGGTVLRMTQSVSVNHPGNVVLEAGRFDPFIGRWTAGTAGADSLRVLVTKQDGSAKGRVFALSDVLKGQDGAGITSLAPGQTGILDLSAMGLGKYELLSGTAGISSDDLLQGLDGVTARLQARAGITQAGSSLVLQVGARAGDTLEINLPQMDPAALGLEGLDIGTQAGASSAIGLVKKAVDQVSLKRAYLGAVENRLEHKINYLNNASENLADAESRVRDTDMAAEMMSLVKNQIRVQASMAMMAYANQMRQNLVRLLWML